MEIENVVNYFWFRYRVLLWQGVHWIGQDSRQLLHLRSEHRSENVSSSSKDGQFFLPLFICNDFRILSGSHLHFWNPIYLLQKVDGQENTDEPVPIKDVYNEFNEKLATKYKIKSFKCRVKYLSTFFPHFPMVTGISSTICFLFRK